MTIDTAPNLGETVAEPDRGDLASGVIVVAVGAAILFYVRGFPTLPSGEPGPALFPGIIGGLMLVMGAILVVRGIAQRTRRAASVDKPVVPYRRGWVNAGCIVGAIVFYLLVVDLLGFLTTVTLMSTLLIVRLGTKVWVAIVAGIVSTVAIWSIFNKVLLVPLPLGFWS